MTDQLEKHAEVLKKFLEDGDTTTVWIVWSEIVEKSFMVGLQIGDGKYSGHGMFRTTEKNVHSRVFDVKSKTLQPSTKHGESQRLLRQSRRLDQAACLLTLLEHNPKADPRQREQWMDR